MIPAWRRHQPKRDAPEMERPPVALPPADPPAVTWLKWLAWSYFILLIAEGALRKWVLPGLATPLLIIRDPVVVAMYVLAAQAGLFPRNGFLAAVLTLAVLSVPLGVIQVAGGDTTPAVLAYGLRTNYLHLPLIFLLPKIFNYDDVRRIGYVVLLLALPMALLMVAQFRAPRDAWLNAAMGDGLQIDAALGKIRPAGTFSFVTGVVSFVGLTAAFLLHGVAKSKLFPGWLLAVAGFGLAASLAVSGSRSAVVTVAVVTATFAVAAMLAGKATAGFLRLAAVGLIVAVVATSTDFLDEGLKVLNARWELAADHERKRGGMTGRWFSEFTEAAEVATKVPVLGLGLGRGTNVGAQLIFGVPGQFLLSESEWSRVICENGPVLGILYLLLRVALTGWLGFRTVTAARAGNTLPLLLYGAGAMALFSGQFGPATQLGFAVFVPGLALAAEQTVAQSAPEPETAAAPAAPKRQFRKPKLKAPVENPRAA